MPTQTYNTIGSREWIWADMVNAAALTGRKRKKKRRKLKVIHNELDTGRFVDNPH